jgi:hypothetical protein
MRARAVVEVGGVNLQSKAVAVALSHRSKAARRASIALVGSLAAIVAISRSPVRPW